MPVRYGAVRVMTEWLKYAAVQMIIPTHVTCDMHHDALQDRQAQNMHASVTGLNDLKGISAEVASLVHTTLASRATHAPSTSTHQAYACAHHVLQH